MAQSRPRSQSVCVAIAQLEDDRTLGLATKVVVLIVDGTVLQRQAPAADAAGQPVAQSLAHRLTEPRSLEVATAAWEKNKNKHNERCDTLQPGKWGYVEADDGKHRTADEVMQLLADAEAANCNLLMNTGPLPDGSIHPDDTRTLREVGKRLSAAASAPGS